MGIGMAIVGTEGLGPISLAVVEMVDPSKIDWLVCENILSVALPSFSFSPSSSFVIHVVVVLAAATAVAVVVVVVVASLPVDGWSWSGLIGTARGCSVTASTVEYSIVEDEGRDVKEEGVVWAESSEATASGACADISGRGSYCSWLC
jgi:hypothetical protein